MSAVFAPTTPQIDFPALQATYTDTKATAGNTYYYVIQAIGGDYSQVAAVAPVEQLVARVARRRSRTG